MPFDFCPTSQTDNRSYQKNQPGSKIPIGIISVMAWAKVLITIAHMLWENKGTHSHTHARTNSPGLSICTNIPQYSFMMPISSVIGWGDAAITAWHLSGTCFTNRKKRVLLTNTSLVKKKSLNHWSRNNQGLMCALEKTATTSLRRWQHIWTHELALATSLR